MGFSAPMMAMPAARKCGRCGHSPESPAEWGGDGADRELVLLHAILSIALPQQTAVSRNERNTAVVFTNPTLSESALNADSDSVGFLKTTAIFRSFRLTAVCCGRPKERMAWRRTSSLSAPPPHTLCHSFWISWSFSVFSGGGHCHHQGTEAYSVLCGFVPSKELQGPRTWTAGVRVNPAHHVLPTWWGLLSESRRFDSS